MPNVNKNTVVLIPVLNEESSIVETIRSIRRYLPLAELVVIDNGSTDETCRRAEGEKVTLLREPQKGKGYAIRKGFSQYDGWRSNTY